jgi:hypothetical protein
MLEEVDIHRVIHINQDPHRAESSSFQMCIRDAKLKQGVNKRGDGRALREYDQEAEGEKKKDHGRQPPEFALPKKFEQLRSNSESS